MSNDRSTWGGVGESKNDSKTTEAGKMNEVQNKQEETTDQQETNRGATRSTMKSTVHADCAAAPKTASRTTFDFVFGAAPGFLLSTLLTSSRRSASINSWPAVQRVSHQTAHTTTHTIVLRLSSSSMRQPDHPAWATALQRRILWSDGAAYARGPRHRLSKSVLECALMHAPVLSGVSESGPAAVARRGPQRSIRALSPQSPHGSLCALACTTEFLSRKLHTNSEFQRRRAKQT